MSEQFIWKCREIGCGAEHLVYKEHIDHVVSAHGLLGSKIIPLSTQNDERKADGTKEGKR